MDSENVFVYCASLCVCVPGGADRAGQQCAFLLQAELHDPGTLKLLTDPLALVQVVNEHELHSYVLAIRHLTHTHTHRGLGEPSVNLNHI